MVDVSVISRQVAQAVRGRAGRAAARARRRPRVADSGFQLGREELARWQAATRLHGDALDGWDEARIGELTSLLSAMNDDLRDAIGPQVVCHGA